MTLIVSVPGIDYTYMLGLQFEADCAPGSGDGFGYLCAARTTNLC